MREQTPTPTSGNLYCNIITATKHSSNHGDISRFTFCDDSFFRFFGGRVDCPTSPWTTDLWEFPTALGDNEHIVDFFKKQFDFDEKETAAILGM